MKIAYDDQIFGRQYVGGISRYILEVASWIKIVDTDIDVFISAGLSINELIKDYQAKKFGLSIQTQKGYRLRNSINKALSHGALGIFKPDIIHETYYRSEYIGPSNSRRVVTIHDMAHEAMPNETKWADLESKWKADAIARCDAIVCISAATKSELLRFFPEIENTKPIRVIHHGCSYRDPSESSLRQVQKDLGKKPYILFVGQRGGYKRFVDLLHAFAILKLNKSFNMVAFGGGPFSPEEVATINGYGLSSSEVIQYSGPDEILYATYKRCKAFIYPSVYEGFGIPILEARAAQANILCSDIPVFREIGDAMTTYFNAGDPANLATQLNKILNTSPSRAISTPSNFSWEKSARQHLALYKDLLAPNSI
ncbi:MAG: glycosyltransferase family 4 protein [Burkholderiales bacterium]|nr:glycosyltransferase family 4 protein [Burkholderiales bacterium]